MPHANARAAGLGLSTPDLTRRCMVQFGRLPTWHRLPATHRSRRTVGDLAAPHPMRPSALHRWLPAWSRPTRNSLSGDVSMLTAASVGVLAAPGSADVLRLGWPLSPRWPSRRRSRLASWPASPSRSAPSLIGGCCRASRSTWWATTAPCARCCPASRRASVASPVGRAAHPADLQPAAATFRCGSDAHRPIGGTRAAGIV